ncbi:MAG: lamin tail domain-containing protein [Hymenobacter sp.]|nr:MAG: lamin tail domain-containing protein [Hymenobacter sp.]
MRTTTIFFAWSKPLNFFFVSLLLSLPQLVSAQSPNIVISQVYTAGGNANAAYNQDFVELFNRSTSPVAITGWTIQYASATGVFGNNC